VCVAQATKLKAHTCDTERIKLPCDYPGIPLGFTAGIYRVLLLPNRRLESCAFSSNEQQQVSIATPSSLFNDNRLKLRLNKWLRSRIESISVQSQEFCLSAPDSV